MSMKLKHMMLILAGTAVLLSGCGNNTTTETLKETETIVESETLETESLAKEAKAYTQEALEKALNLKKDRYVLVDAEDVDLKKFADYNKDIVTKLSCDNSEVDLSKEGTYPVTYTMEIDAEAMDQFLQSDEAKDKAKETEKTKESSEAKSEAELVKASVESNVTVVSAEKAAELTKEKIAVLTDGNKTYTAKADGAEKETEKSKKSEKETEPVKTADSGKTKDKNKDSGKNGSQGTSNQSGTTSQKPQAPAAQEPQQPQTQAPAAQEPQQPQTQAPAAQEPQQPQTQAPAAQEPQQPQTQAPETQAPHVHTWVVNVPAWDEPVYETKIVCGCGAVFDNDSQWEQHSIDGCPYGYTVTPVQTGSIPHEATYICSGCGATK